MSMTTRQWYSYLLNKDVLKTTHEDGSESNRLCKAELLSPSIDWISIWRRSRLKTEERVHSTLGNIPASCGFGCPEVTADLKHCFFKCCMIEDIGTWLLVLASKFGTTNEDKT